MNLFPYTSIPANLASLDISHKLEALHDHDALRDTFAGMPSEDLAQLRDNALADSAHASIAYQGQNLSDERLRAIMDGREQPSTGAECLATGQIYVLDLIQNRFQSMMVSPGVIMQLHRDLFYFGKNDGGKWRSAEEDAAATITPRVPAQDIAWCMRQLCHSYSEGIKATDRDPVILAAMFACDMIRIDPFSAANQIMARMMLQELLLKNGWSFIPYASLDKALLADEKAWDSAIAQSCAQWPQEVDYLPFVTYVLTALNNLCIALGSSNKAMRPAFNEPKEAPCDAPEIDSIPVIAPESAATAAPTTNSVAAPVPTTGTAATPAPKRSSAHKTNQDQTKSKRTSSNEETIRAYFAAVTEPVTKTQIMADNSSMSQKTIERILQKMQREGAIERIGAARATKYAPVR